MKISQAHASTTIALNNLRLVSFEGDQGLGIETSLAAMRGPMDASAPKREGASLGGKEVLGT